MMNNTTNYFEMEQAYLDSLPAERPHSCAHSPTYWRSVRADFAAGYNAGRLAADLNAIGQPSAVEQAAIDALRLFNEQGNKYYPGCAECYKRLCEALCTQGYAVDFPGVGPVLKSHPSFPDHIKRAREQLAANQAKVAALELAFTRAGVK